MDIQEKLNEIIKASGERIKQSIPIQSVPKSPNPLGFYKWYKKEIEWADSQTDSIEKLCGINSSCSKGCSFCCNQPIPVTSTEMLGIKQYIKNQNMKDRRELYKVTLDVCNRLIESGIQINRNKVSSEKSIQKYMAEYFSLNISCPLLSENKTCLIYEVRPTNCWSYRVYGDPKDCENCHNPDHGIKFDDWEMVVLKRAFEAKKPDRDTILLPFALRDILEQMI